MAEETNTTANPSQALDDLTQEEQEAMAAIKAKFNGRWKETHSENTDEFFKEMGVNFFLRKLVGMARPEMELQVGETNIIILVKLPGKTEESSLRLNKETENTNSQGVFLTKATFENGNLVTHATPKDPKYGKPVHVTREITEGGDLSVTFRCNEIVCKRVFTKL